MGKVRVGQMSSAEIYITMCKIASENAQIFNGESFLNFKLSHWHIMALNIN